MSTTKEQTIRRYLDEHGGQENGAAVEELLASLAIDETQRPGEQRGSGKLKLACVFAALSGIGLITGAVLGVAVDTAGVTTAGTIAGISAGGIFAVGWVALIVNWYGKRTMPPEKQEEPSSSKTKPKPSSSKQKPSPSKR